MSTIALLFMAFVPGPPFAVSEEGARVKIVGEALEASVRKTGYVSGVEAQSFLDKATGARDLGFGLDIVDWVMEPGSDEAYRDQLEGDLPYLFNNSYHGKRAKRAVEGPQICTKAGKLDPIVIKGPDFVAIKQSFVYQTAAPGRNKGSLWEQTLVFPAGKRWFLSSDKVTSANEVAAPFLRVDMPGHVKHQGGDSFSEIYLSYHGKVPSSEFAKDFAPDEKFLYVRDDARPEKRFVRAYHLKDGPWLAGMTLDPKVVTEAWCHQRGYVCMIEEFGGRPVKKGESFGAAFLVGYFDSIEEMERTYDAHEGHQGLSVDAQGWRLTKGPH